jgi:hypothetical protein
MVEKIKEISASFDGYKFRSGQDFILFNEAEFEAVQEAMKETGYSKARVLGIGCTLLIQEIEKHKAKSDGEKV